MLCAIQKEVFSGFRNARICSKHENLDFHFGISYVEIRILGKNLAMIICLKSEKSTVSKKSRFSRFEQIKVEICFARSREKLLEPSQTRAYAHNTKTWTLILGRLLLKFPFFCKDIAIQQDIELKIQEIDCQQKVQVFAI